MSKRSLERLSFIAKNLRYCGVSNDCFTKFLEHLANWFDSKGAIIISDVGHSAYKKRAIFAQYGYSDSVVERYIDEWSWQDPYISAAKELSLGEYITTDNIAAITPCESERFHEEWEQPLGIEFTAVASINGTHTKGFLILPGIDSNSIIHEDVARQGLHYISSNIDFILSEQLFNDYYRALAEDCLDLSDVGYVAKVDSDFHHTGIHYSADALHLTDDDARGVIRQTKKVFQTRAELAKTPIHSFSFEMGNFSVIFLSRCTDISIQRHIGFILIKRINLKLHELMETVGLTGTEQEICQRLIDGETPKEIAFNRHISDSTVRVHIKHICEKLHVDSLERLHYLLASYR